MISNLSRREEFFPMVTRPFSRAVAIVALGVWVVTVGGLGGPFWVGLAAAEGTREIPASWMASWQEPPLADWPLQIVHGLTPRRVGVDAVEQILQQPLREIQTDEGMGYYLRRGRGGIVCNVSFRDYLESEEAWKVLVEAVNVCSRLGMPVWIYDERGYPSGAAGGLVLRHHPEVEALVLARDPEDPREFFLRPAFEHTHAANNYHAVRRYINLLDDRATQYFIELTHEAYYQRLKDHFGKTIVAFFTDEPSLMAVNLGPIPEPARSRVPIQDPPDPNVKRLPTVPWGYDLAECYQKRYGQDLVAVRKSLFEGDTAEDIRVRRQFWSLVADLVAERYFGQIRQWCRQRGVASSGHNLAEESVLLHVPLYGNGLKALAYMDIPGLDMLSSRPQVVANIGWMTAALPLSAALLEGGRRVMTEVSDFSEKMFGTGPVSLAEMQATAAWQAAWGVTEFTLYYSPEDRSVEDNWQYGQFVGRLNAVLKPAMPVPEVALYYPIYDLWAYYRPVAERPTNESQPPQVGKLLNSFYRLGRALQRRQIPFVLVDHEYLAKARPVGERLVIGKVRLSAVVLPSGVELPPEADNILTQFASNGGKVVKDRAEEPLTPNTIRDLLAPEFQLHPASDEICLGRFVRDGRTILVLVNVGQNPWEGFLTVAGKPEWSLLDPHTGTVMSKQAEGERLPLRLERYQTLLLVD